MVDNNLTYAVKRRALDKVAGDRNFIYSYFLSLTYIIWDNSPSFSQTVTIRGIIFDYCKHKF